MQAAQRNRYDGVGFVFVQVTDRLYICGIDIDHQSGESPLVRDICDMFPNAYIEYSPSGEGVHLVFTVDISKIPTERAKDGKTKLNKRYYQKNPNNGVECYVAGLTNRYFTHTGRIIQDGKDIEQTAEFLKFLDCYMLREQPNEDKGFFGGFDEDIRQNVSNAEQTPLDLTDNELLDKARNAHNGKKFSALFDSGNIQGFESQSNADMSLMNMLAFWTACDPYRMERLFTQSALGQRDKWKREDYRQATVNAACAACTSMYEPKGGGSQGNYAPSGNSGAARVDNRKAAAKAEDYYAFMPSDYSDVGQAQLLARLRGNLFRYCESTDFLVYDGGVWYESKAKAQGLQQALTDRQFRDSKRAVLAAYSAVAAADTGENDTESKNAAAKALKKATEYRNFALKFRQAGKVTAALYCVRPYVEVEIKELDTDGFLLNTPSGTIDLRTGQMRNHNPEDYCTKITSVSPNYDNMQMWLNAVNMFCCGDESLANYLQEVSGMFAIGKVLCENLIIAIGTGKNGKSTFFNTIAAVLGTYSGGLSAEILTTGYKGNAKAELAEIRGKRLIVAAELEEGMRLNTAAVKKIASTDRVRAEPKYQKPFDYVPTHSTVLYTNHLPKVGTSDSGTWRRLVVVPFNATIPNNSDIKNYADFLCKKCGGAVLSWIIEGARKFIQSGYELSTPQCVANAIADYKTASDWLGAFLQDVCNVGDGCMPTKSSTLYQAYRAYTLDRGEYVRSASDFSQALSAAGYETHKQKQGMFVYKVSIDLQSEYYSHFN
jgi:P4 family phage/plasmid primase-like protien